MYFSSMPKVKKLILEVQTNFAIVHLIFIIFITWAGIHFPFLKGQILCIVTTNSGKTCRRYNIHML